MATHSPPVESKTANTLEELRASVSAELSGQVYGATGRVLKSANAELRRQAIQRFARGEKIAEAIAGGTDELIIALFDAVFQEAHDKLALCAIGGYGRKELAPYSDIDLLILQPAKDNALRVEELNRFLYPLWDSGAKVGHSTHTVRSAIEFASNDIVGRTAYLDARILTGDQKLFDEFGVAYEKLRRRTKNEFVAAKLKEQNLRHEAAFETRYLIEPDIKEGKGGLRDLQTIHWLVRYVFGRDATGLKRVVGVAEQRSLAKVARFLWSVRAVLHDLRGRADDRLTFDIQPAVAERLGYSDRPGMAAAERLMKHYFVNAVEVGRLTRIVCARLEEERAKHTPRLPNLTPKMLQGDEAPGKPNIRLRGNRLDFASPAKARRQPRDYFRLFRALSKSEKFDIHPDALALISEHTASITRDVRRDPTNAKLFKASLLNAADPVRFLRVMTESGLLGKYVPSFGSIVGRIKYGLYRRFTLDEQVLRSLGVLAEINRSKLKDEHPIATQIVRRADDPFVFYLALLLHEAVWTVKDQSPDACEKLAARVARRLQLEDDDIDAMSWAVANFGVMARTAERRNLADPTTIRSFAARVGDRARLDLSLVICVCSLRVIGEQSWDELTRRQLSELYEATRAWLDEGEASLETRLQLRAKQARDTALSRMEGWDADQREAFLDRLTPTMLRGLDPSVIVRFANLVRAAEAEDAACAVTVSQRDGDLEAIIYAEDRKGLLSDIAGAVAQIGLGVRSVQAMTTADGKALDIFIIQSVDGAPLEDSRQLQRLHSAMLKAAQSPPRSRQQFGRRIGDRRAIFSVKPEARLLEEAAEDCLVVETEGLDRPGLLHDLCETLSDLGATIVSAHIATYGERAVDTFYLQDESGQPITQARKKAAIERKLVQTLGGGAGG